MNDATVEYLDGLKVKPFDMKPLAMFVRSCTAAARLADKLGDPDTARAILRGVAVAATPLMIVEAELE